MNNSSINLKDCCHINDNKDDRFVGVKINDQNVDIYFPLGYELPDDERQLKKEIRTLFKVLLVFKSKEEKTIKTISDSQYNYINFPIQAYLDVIDYYINNNCCYYIETTKKYRKDTKGKINWKRTIKQNTAFVKNNYPVYTEFQVEYQTPLIDELITKINKYCVYAAYTKLWWLYGIDSMSKPELLLTKENKKVFVNELQKKISNTNKEKDKRLFSAMKIMIESIDDKNITKQYYFGTEKFEYVWEKIIDKVFGISNKNDYFTKAEWTARYGDKNKIKTHPLMPDTIMIYKTADNIEKIYVLDAKYYKYGVTGAMDDLPDSSSINKQITYAEYIESKMAIPNTQLYNAFLMPYNMQKNKFNITDSIANVAEAQGDWRKKQNNIIHNYEKIQGIVIDTRYLLRNYLGDHLKDKKALINEIEKYLKDTELK